MSTSLSICSINIFYCFTAGKRVGVGCITHGVSSSTIIPPTAGPDLAVALDVHTHIVCGEFQVWVGVHRFCICLTEQAL